MAILHPYYPSDLILPNYVPNTFTAPTLVGIIGAAFVTVVFSSYLIFQNFWPHSSSGERWTATWFVVCGVLHLGFEGTHPDPLFSPKQSTEYNQAHLSSVSAI
jgi:cholestenol delta-isomerase